MFKRKMVAGLALALLSPVVALATTSTASHAGVADDLTYMFQNYGNTSGEWSGGDGTQSLKLTDGRVLWFFSDTYHGVATNGVRRMFGASMINNSMVIQNATTMETVERRNAANQPMSMVPAARAGEWLWSAGQTQVGDSVYKFYMRVVAQGTGALGFRVTGTELVKMPVATINNPNTFTKVTLPTGVQDCGTTPGSCTLWGMDLLDDGGYTYIYGTDAVTGGDKHLKLARVPVGNFAASGWQYWTGSTWSDQPAQAARMMGGVSEGFSVAPVGNRFVLLTQGTEGGLGGDMYTFSSNTPTGFNASSRSRVYVTPETTTDYGRWTYEYRIVEHLTNGNQIVASYNQNSHYTDNACASDSYVTASVYRPRFVTITVPTTPTGGGDVPPSKTPPGSPWSMTPAAHCSTDAAVPMVPTTAVTAASGARVTLTWQAPNSGLWNYEVQYRDKSANEQFESLTPTSPDTRTRTAFLFTPATNKWELGGLHPGHDYEFRVRATSWNGESSATRVSGLAKAYLATPTGITVTKPSSTKCTVSWTDTQPSVLWEINERNRSTNKSRILGYYSTRSVTLTKPTSNSYEYKVRAANSKGAGAWTAGRVC